MAGAELLDGKDGAIFFAAHQANGATGTSTEHLAELSILAGQSVIVSKRKLGGGTGAWGCLCLGLCRCWRRLALLVMAGLAEEALQVSHGTMRVMMAMAMGRATSVTGIVLGGKGARASQARSRATG